MLFVIGQPHPLMHDQDAGTRAVDGVVIGDESFERRVALFVFDGLRVDGGAGHPGTGQGQKSEH